MSAPAQEEVSISPTIDRSSSISMLFIIESSLGSGGGRSRGSGAMFSSCPPIFWRVLTQACSISESVVRILPSAWTVSMLVTARGLVAIL